MSFSHSGTPQSPREDYAILSHYCASSVDVQDQHHTESLSDSPRGIPIRGKGSADATAGDFLVSERTPLLQPPPPIPRLHEPADEDVHDTASVEQVPTSKMFREELRILTLYSLPVFGCVLPFVFPPSTYLYFIFSKYSPFRTLFHNRFRRIYRSYFYACPGSRHIRLYDGFCYRIQHHTRFCINP